MSYTDEQVRDLALEHLRGMVYQCPTPGCGGTPYIIRTMQAGGLGKFLIDCNACHASGSYLAPDGKTWTREEKLVIAEAYQRSDVVPCPSPGDGALLLLSHQLGHRYRLLDALCDFCGRRFHISELGG